MTFVFLAGASNPARREIRVSNPARRDPENDHFWSKNPSKIGIFDKNVDFSGSGLSGTPNFPVLLSRFSTFLLETLK